MTTGVHEQLGSGSPSSTSGAGAGASAIDTVDAGVGDTVLIVSGSSARMAVGMKDMPVDAVVVGVVDHVDVPE